MAKTLGTSSVRLVAQLKSDYMRRVREVAIRVRPKLAGVRDLGGDELQEPAELLKRACRSALCRTNEDARLVLLLSPHRDHDDIFEYHDIRYGAAVRVALDAAKLINARWFLKYHGAFGSERGRLA